MPAFCDLLLLLLLETDTPCLVNASVDTEGFQNHTVLPRELASLGVNRSDMKAKSSRRQASFPFLPSSMDTGPGQHPYHWCPAGKRGFEEVVGVCFRRAK